MNKLYLLPAALAASALLAACASIGRPDGGPRDVDPPQYVWSNPVPGTVNFSGNKISIYFDENVQLDDPASKVAISPAQIQQPTLFANGRRVDVELKDSMMSNTTYTIDLADAVKDLNEGNVLDGFALDFSTGPEIDSLGISGMVLKARDLEPAQGMLVGVYMSDADSCITTRPFERIARTNQLGEFTVRNLKPGKYQIFALNDMNRDYHWDRSEDVAFMSELVVPEIDNVEVTDTVAPDSLVRRTVTRYLPDNLLLTWFNEEYKAQYLKTYKREPRNIIHLEMAAPVDSLPQLTIIAMGKDSTMRVPLSDVAVLSRTVNGDTLDYWLRNQDVIAADTLLIETRYRRVDSLSALTWQTDTLKFNIRNRGKKASQQGPRSLQQKIDSVLAISDTMRIDTFALMQPDVWLTMNVDASSQDLNKPLRFSVNRPIDSIAPGSIRLQVMVDSAWTPVDPQPEILPADSISGMKLMMRPEWIPGMKYQLTVDSMAVTDIYGYYTRPSKSEFNTRKTEDYSTVIFNITGVPDGEAAVVELLKNSDAVVATCPLQNGTARFEYLLPATYYARLFVDRDSNGIWTNGNLTERIQPEDVYYFNKKLVLKKNWDRIEPWDINVLSPELQKPLEIKTNRPRRKAGEMPEAVKPDEEDEDDMDGFGTNHFSNQRRL